MKKCNLTHLEELEAESIHILREASAQFSSSGLLFSGGKDSLVCLHLIAKAFYPANSPLLRYTLTESITFRGYEIP